MMTMRNIILLMLILFVCSNAKAQVAPSWTKFLEDQEKGQQSILPDYSFAGYHFSEKELPDVSTWTQFDVTDFGAVANDDLHDDDAIQATINAAETHNGPAVVFFPPGRFVVSENNRLSEWISISRDSIVLKGSGSGEGGTELFMDQMRAQNGHWQFRFQPENVSNTGLATISEPAKRGDFSVKVVDPSKLEVGQVIFLFHKSEEFARAHFGERELSPDWARLFGSGGGMSMYEPHIISAISGNRITFHNPVQADMPELKEPFSIRMLETIQEVGVEDILFSSNWENFGESFVHHKNDIHNYGWNALRFDNVRNAWVRNCAFRSWNQALDVRQSIGVTVENSRIYGEKGHASISTRRSFGLLVKDSRDESGQHHGPGTGFQSVNTVYLRYIMQRDQSVDSHSGQPYATLLDNVAGGDFDQNGGPLEGYPHHGQHLTFWNFKHSSSVNRVYDFWPDGRNGNTYANPLFIGFQADTDIEFRNAGLDELNGENVEPASLFESQLELRLKKAAVQPTVSFEAPGNGDKFSKGTDLEVTVLANDPDGSITKVTLFLNDEVVGELTEFPYVWGSDTRTDELLENIPVGAYELKTEAIDENGNIALDSINISIGSLPASEFITPDAGEIIEVGSGFMVEADASDEDGSIESATLFIDDVALRTIEQPPFVWGESDLEDPQLYNLASGERVLAIEVIDNDGLKFREERTIYANVYPTVSFDSPADNDVFEFGSSLILRVLAEDLDDQVERVQMFINEEKLRDEISAPFEWGLRSDSDPELFNLIDGEYVFTAVVIDSLGSQNSTSIKVIIESENVVTSIPERVVDKLNVYPIPFAQSVRIDLSANEIKKAVLFDITGKDLTDQMKLSVSGKQIVAFMPDLSSSGIFYLTLTLNNDVVHIIRLIKE